MFKKIKTHFLIKLFIFTLFLLFQQAVFARQIVPTLQYLTDLVDQFDFAAVYSYEYERYDWTDTGTRTNKVDTFFTYNINDDLTFIVKAPYKWVSDDIFGRYSSLDDITFYFKDEFYKKYGWQLSIMPNVSVPTGAWQRDIGAGRMTYGAVFAVSKDIGKFLNIEVDIDYLHNENKRNQRIDLGRYYFIPTFHVTERLDTFIVAHTENDKYKLYTRPVIYLAGGLHYDLTKHWSIAPSIEFGFNKPEKDVTFYCGLVWKH
ncbi:MAG: transporter [Gammaproteobacteria bacterium]